MQLFSNLFETLSEKNKSDYLFKLLESNSTLKSDFIRYFESSYEQLRLETVLPFSFDDELVLITEKADSVAETLGELDFEETDWDRWQDSGHYTPDYEVAQIVAEEEASEVFEEFKTALKMVLETGNLIDIVSDFTAVFHGINCAEINDPYCNLGDPANDYFISELNELVKENQKILIQRMFTDADYQNALELTFSIDKIHYNDEKTYLQFIIAILLAVVNDKKHANMVWLAKEKFNAHINIVPEFLNKVTKLIGDKKIWIESLESCFLQDFDTSIDLMEYYHENDNGKFEKVAPQLWGRFNYRALDYLLEKVRKGTPFHVSLLKKHAAQNGKSASLELLKQYISSQEVEQFIDLMGNNNTKAKFYAHEKLFDKLITLIEANCIQSTSLYSSIEFEKVIPYLFADRPLVVWKMIEKVITVNMQNNRSRATYNYIANLLKKAQKIEGIDIEIRSLASKLYNLKPNLPALKDELRKAGIV
jgi:hypothetical protein